MNNKKILDLLERLNKALTGLDASDAKSRAKLYQLIRKISLKLGEPGPSKQELSLAGDIKDAIMHFEVEHPVIAEILGEIKMALYSIGL